MGGVDIGGLVSFFQKIVELFLPTPEQRAANFQKRQLKQEARFLRKNPHVNTITYIETIHPEWTDEEKKARVQALTDLL